MDFTPLPPLSRVQELLYLDEAGCLRWRVQRGRIRPGELAGKRDRRLNDRSVGIDGKQYRSNRLIWLLKHGEDPGEQRLLTGVPLGRSYARRDFL